MPDQPKPQTTPDLEKMLFDGMEFFNLPEPESSGPVNEPAPSPEKPADTPAPEPEKPEIGEPPETVDPKDFRFKDHPSAEKGYRHIQQEKTRLEQELVRYRKEAETRAAQEKADEEKKRKEQADEYAVSRREESLRQIEDLDPDDPEHTKKVARIMTEVERDIRRKEQEIFTVATPPGTPSGEKPPQESKPDNAQATEEPPAPAEILEYIDGKVKATGLDPTDPDWIVCSSRAPQTGEDGRPLTLDQQIEWAIEETKKQLAARRAKILQEAEMPLGRTGTGYRPSPAASADRPLSLSDALDRAAESRRI